MQPIKWGYVRDFTNSLYINNIYFAMDMSDNRWIDIENKF